jgi:peptidoglycan/xylan/chitin deacetylase (PgdA/CDA1 family)
MPPGPRRDRSLHRSLCVALALAATAVGAGSAQVRTSGASDPAVTILVYHRFAPVATDAMTVRPATFRRHLDYLRRHHHPVIPLRALVTYLQGQGPAPPARSVVITVDDGHASVFSEMRPIVLEHRMPVTLFIYPSAISNASYAMSWEQLAILRGTGLFDVQSHTYWHPNFHTERRRLSTSAYGAFTATQITKSRRVLAGKLGAETDLIAWPFGIYDDDLVAAAREAGFIAGFTIDRRTVSGGDNIMTLPRVLMTDVDTERTLASILPRETR